MMNIFKPINSIEQSAPGIFFSFLTGGIEYHKWE